MAGSSSVISNNKAPLGIVQSESKKAFGLKIVKKEPVGELEAYFCTSCGFYETYIKNPSSIHFDGINGFKWLKK